MGNCNDRYCDGYYNGHCHHHHHDGPIHTLIRAAARPLAPTVVYTNQPYPQQYVAQPQPIPPQIQPQPYYGGNTVVQQPMPVQQTTPH